MSIFHSVWEGDHWGSAEKDIAVTVTYQAGSHTYVTSPVTEIALGRFSIFGTCADIIEAYDVDFSSANTTGQFEPK